MFTLLLLRIFSRYFVYLDERSNSMALITPDNNFRLTVIFVVSIISIHFYLKKTAELSNELQQCLYKAQGVAY